MWNRAFSSLLRYNQRLTRHVPTQQTFKRNLNVSQTADALRPFLFAVHPDFFGQHPKERATNEHSLKQLYAYIDSLRRDSRVSPVDLTFYLRNHVLPTEQIESDHGSFRPVNISLLSTDLYKTVTHILQSCDISTDHVQQKVKQVQYGTGSSRSTQEVNWNAFYYDFVEKASKPKRYSGSTFSKDDIDIPLCLWMKLNLESSRKKMVASEPIREEADELEKELKENLGLEEISWKCPWDINHFRSCLRTTRDLTEEYPDIFQNLKGGKLVFGNTTRLSYEGKAVLGHRDVPQYWLGLVHNLSKYFEIFSAISSLEDQISSRLGGIKVCRVHLNKTPFKAYYQVLQQLLKSLCSYEEECKESGASTELIQPDSLADMKMQIISGSRPPLLAPSGKVYISNISPPAAIVEFLTSNQDDARQILKLNKESKEQVAQLIERCQKVHKFSEFNMKDTVTNEEMQSCCRRLLSDASITAMDLRGAKIRVGLHYNLLGSGEMCIPWNWK